MADVFLGTGSVFTGLTSGLVVNGPLGLGGSYFDLSYDRMPGNERGYGFDFAHIGGSPFMDGIQTSRGYQLIYDAIGAETGHGAPWHWNLTSSSSSKRLQYKRGRSTPRGGEDGVIADFDHDGDLDILYVGQRAPSDSHPDKGTPQAESAIMGFLWNEQTGLPGTLKDTFHHATNTQTLVSTDPAFSPTADDLLVEVDDSILPDGRNAWPAPINADRAVAADLNNDGLTDAIVQLFQVNYPGFAGGYIRTLDKFSPAGGPATPAASFLCGWRLLLNHGKNVGGLGNSFSDNAPTNLKDATTGMFSEKWNRPPGMTCVADFDNNGSLDFYTVSGLLQDAQAQPIGDGNGNYVQLGVSNTVQVLDQIRDLLFMNAVSGNPSGVFVEDGKSILGSLGECPDIAVPIGDLPDNMGVSYPHDRSGAFGVASGDIDNDGDTDVLVFHATSGGSLLANYPYLLINTQSLGTLGFSEEFQTRIPIANLDPVITTPTVDLHGGGTADGMDYAMMGGFLDFDGDGDLDLIYSVRQDLPRVLQNVGVDSNSDGRIDQSDSPAPGIFVDITGSALLGLRPSNDANDFAVVDIDDDGDLDFIIESNDDIPCVWRNNTPISSAPKVTEVWPRIGAIQGAPVRLVGRGLNGADLVRFNFANGVQVDVPISANQSCAGCHGPLDEITLRVPASGPIGLAQIRVRVGGVWSTQYFGYFVQG